MELAPFSWGGLGGETLSSETWHMAGRELPSMSMSSGFSGFENT